MGGKRIKKKPVSTQQPKSYLDAKEISMLDDEQRMRTLSNLILDALVGGKLPSQFEQLP